MNTNAVVAPTTVKISGPALLIHLGLAGCTLAALALDLVGQKGWPWLALPYAALMPWLLLQASS